MRRRRREITERGPPFVEIEGILYRNLAFDLRPLGEDVRDSLGKELGVAASRLLLLQQLDDEEAHLVLRQRDDAEVEVWALLTDHARRRR